MYLKAGIIGMPNVGKSTLFNAITKNNILAANYPFATIDPNVGIVIVPDERIKNLFDMYNPKKLIPAQYQFTDIAGLVKGASNGEGLGNKFLSHIREVDAVVHVIRCFEDKDIIHVEGSVNPKRDIEIINLELNLSDLEIIENRLEKIEKKAKTSNDLESLIEVNLLKKCKQNLAIGLPLRKIELNEEELKILKPYNLISLKPIIYIANVGEDDLIGNFNPYIEELKEEALNENIPLIKMCAKTESELISLSDVEKQKFLNDLGIEMSGLDQLISVTYSILGLKTFFTVGEDEVRAWTFIDGMKAPECAGIIHTDFQKGFIRAEIISYNDLIDYKSELKVKENGKMRLEGKEYLMQDGDICHFRFNV